MVMLGLGQYLSWLEFPEHGPIEMEMAPGKSSCGKRPALQSTELNCFHPCI